MRQRIWRHSGLFDAGNTFLLETMDITTERLIVVVDQTVGRGQSRQPVTAPHSEASPNMDVNMEVSVPRMP